MHNFIADAEQQGLRNVPTTPVVDLVLPDLIRSHVESFQFAFYLSTVIAIVGAITSYLLVRRVPRTLDHPIFGRRSRWVLANAGATTPGVTRVPPPPAGAPTATGSTNIQ